MHETSKFLSSIIYKSLIFNSEHEIEVHLFLTLSYFVYFLLKFVIDHVENNSSMHCYTLLFIYLVLFNPKHLKYVLWKDILLTCDICWIFYYLVKWNPATSSNPQTKNGTKFLFYFIHYIPFFSQMYKTIQKINLLLLLFKNVLATNMKYISSHLLFEQHRCFKKSLFKSYEPNQ